MKKNGLYFLVVLGLLTVSIGGCGRKTTGVIEPQPIFEVPSTAGENSAGENVSGGAVAEGTAQDTDTKKIVPGEQKSGSVTTTLYYELPEYVEHFERIGVTSSDLNEEWDVSIGNTLAGENVSPQLSWKSVVGSECYAIYMLNETSSHWVQLKATDRTNPYLEKGEITSVKEKQEQDVDAYIGPCPTIHSTNEYIVYVFALKKPLTEYPGNVGTFGKGIDYIAEELDAGPDGEGGNIIAFGYLSGLFSRGG